MQEHELLNKIFNTPNWYEGICTKNYSYILQYRYDSNSLSQGTIDRIIKLSGYVIDTERTYKKK